jgi:membrane fusion protein, heavy metal efflux system
MKHKYLNSLLISVIIVFILSSCGNKKPGEDDNKSDIIFSGDTVKIPETSSVATKLNLLKVVPQEYTTSCTTTGTVKPLAGHLAEVSVPFEGRITKSFVKLGQRVAAGAPLFEVNSTAYIDAVQSFVKARETKTLAEKNYNRKKDLFDNGVSSKKEFEEAEADKNIADKEYADALAGLHIFNFNGDEPDLSKPLIVRSPISGEVVKNNITVGQYQKTDSDPVITVAELGRVWIVAKVKEKNIGQISHQDKVEVMTESNAGKPVEGFVDYIGNIMDEQTRSVEVFVECGNSDKTLKPGMFVTTSFEHNINDVIIVPSNAVLQQEDQSYVFVKIGESTFCKRTVSVYTNGNDHNLIVRSGLTNGDIIIADGGFYLK